MAPAHDEDDDEVAGRKGQAGQKKKVDRARRRSMSRSTRSRSIWYRKAATSFCSCRLSVEVDDPQVGEQIKLYTPKLRNDLTCSCRARRLRI
jgi:hypothetical protein